MVYSYVPGEMIFRIALFFTPANYHGYFDIEWNDVQCEEFNDINIYKCDAPIEVGKGLTLSISREL